MRFLCLHGKGTNSDIFEAQLAWLRSRVSPSHTFDFIDAEFDCPPSPGVVDFYPGPYLGWHACYYPSAVEKTHDTLREIIEEDGPYDGVIGFSEGAAVAASLLLCDEHWKQTGDSRARPSPLFKLAIFFNSVMLFSPSEDLGVQIGHKIKDQEDKLAGFTHGLTGDDNGPDDIPNVYAFTPEFSARISVPTLHVIGSEDLFTESSRELADLCPGQAEVVVHDGGHELPRGEVTMDRCGALFETLVMMASVGEA
ncbi:EF-hand calcium-binding domain protein [Penicillium capsulatum]|uniref:EF-hand calcium-binding domain protein n=1 Tax=Penicillium capsulatum TaxID=69766 RepID=A0A9W9HRX2_9EURO|nr:EF-hand calcium-binding domain protein [Penicillium capsulatum]KAJ6106044.1 EF-hand calcium-binding domain protein [Penicillium capsulatum]